MIRFIGESPERTAQWILAIFPSPGPQMCHYSLELGTHEAHSKQKHQKSTKITPWFLKTFKNLSIIVKCDQSSAVGAAFPVRWCVSGCLHGGLVGSGRSTRPERAQLCHGWTECGCCCAALAASGLVHPPSRGKADIVHVRSIQFTFRARARPTLI